MRTSVVVLLAVLLGIAIYAIVGHKDLLGFLHLLKVYLIELVAFVLTIIGLYAVLTGHIFGR